MHDTFIPASPEVRELAKIARSSAFQRLQQNSTRFDF